MILKLVRNYKMFAAGVCDIGTAQVECSETVQINQERESFIVDFGFRNVEMLITPEK